MQNSFLKLSFRFLSYWLFFGLLLPWSSPSISAQTSVVGLKLKDFNKEKVARGLKWYHFKTSEVFDSQQSINILSIHLKKRQLDLLYQPDTLLTTASYANLVAAKAAVNAGFFNMKEGGSVTYLKKDGQVLAENQVDLETKGSVVIQGALVIYEDGKVLIQKPQATQKYTQNQAIDDVLLSGPLLLENGKTLALKDTPFNQDRHPRTCACTLSDKRLLLLTIDGRHQEAVGMSLPELRELLQVLGCKNAINLDGGGSTTMYLSSTKKTGIINYPSDNRQFDHQGQRKVSNVLVVH